MLNRLLAAEPWARERLAPFAGETLELRAPPLPALRLVILPGGTLEAGGEAPGLVVTLRPGSIDVTGSEPLAAEVRTLLRDVRWDAEEDLSKVVGDVAAHRLAQAARGFLAWQADAARRLIDALADYAAEEKRVLVSRPDLERFAGEMARLREGIERLEERVGRLG